MIKQKVEFRLGFYYFFTLDFVDRKDIENCDGKALPNNRLILIADDLDETATILTIRHEIVHSILGIQGRVYQKKFDVEEMCEFIAYKLPEIIDVMNHIEKKLEIN